MKRSVLLSFVLLWSFCAGVGISISQGPAVQTSVSSPSAGPDERDVYIKRWVENYNKRGRPIISVAFRQFRTLTEHLNGRLQRAFPKHRLTVVDLKFHHNGTWDESYALVQNRMSKQVIGFYGPMDAYNSHSPDPYSVLLSSYRARDRTDALFRSTALLDFLALVGNERIQEVKRGKDEFTFLICSNSYSITDLGQVIHVPFDRTFAFGRLYFQHDLWERNKCRVFGAPSLF